MRIPLILVADPDPDLRKIFDFALSREGYRVVDAADGEEALFFFQICRPDLVICAAELAIVDGVKACRVLRAYPDGKTLPIIVTSSDVRLVAVRRLLEAGATHVALKPLAMEGLLERVARALRRPSASACRLAVAP